MGTDIHGIWQKKTESGWKDISSEYDQDRHYQLFAILAGVRNGLGFGGAPTGDEVVPISEPRGLPTDFSLLVETWEEGDNENEPEYPSNSHLVESVNILPPWLRNRVHRDPLYMWMGDHTHSWVTGEEILKWFDASSEVTHLGILSRKEYETWDKVSKPESYCGGVYGAGIKVITENQINDKNSDNWTHVQCSWKSDLKKEMKYFIDEVRRLISLYGEIRFVFGFDS